MHCPFHMNEHGDTTAYLGNTEHNWIKVAVNGDTQAIRDTAVILFANTFDATIGLRFARTANELEYSELVKQVF